MKEFIDNGAISNSKQREYKCLLFGCFCGTVELEAWVLNLIKINQSKQRWLITDEK